MTPASRDRDPSQREWDKVSSELLDRITDTRVEASDVIVAEARKRKRRSRLTRDGKLVLVAIDHAARGVTEIRGDKLAMGDRRQLLSRARRVLEDPNLDGVLVSSDVLDDLLILSHFERTQTGRSFLDERVIIGSMNRGGLAGAAFEMEDTFTSFTAERLVEMGCGGGKMLLRIDPADPASGRTLTACAHAITSLRQHNLPAFVEPLPVRRKETGGYETLKDAENMVRIIGIASGIGDSSAHIWLKVSCSPDLARVAQATTLPILLLGGPAREKPEDMLRDFAAGFAAGSRVRGAIIGRNLLYPGNADPLPMCRALTALVHKAASLDDALAILNHDTQSATAG